MKQSNLLFMSAAMMLASCGGTKDAGQNGTLIERSDIKIEGKRMTPEALWAMGRIGSVAVSPDEKQIAYSVAYYSVPENKSNNELFVMNADGSSNRQITRDSWQESQPVWIKDGKKIAFLCNESGSSQVWEMNPDGTERKQLTRYEGDIEGFAFSPDGIEQLAWSPASDKVAYTCRKKTGLAYAVSTNSDIYIYDLATGKTENITEENKGYDTNPQYSPDGKYIAWQSMERDGYEADLNRLFVMNLATGEKRFVSRAFESNVDAFLWNKDSQSIYFIGVWHGETQIYNIGLADNDSLNRLTDGMHDYASLALCGDKLIAKRHSMSMGDEIYAVNNTRSGNAFAEAEQLTFENKQIYDQLEMGKVEARWMTTTDGKQMLTWVIYPPQFDPNKKYPTLLFCEGGPQSPVSQFWSYRWNFQIMAANDYIIVAPNRRGLPGFGVEWNEAISGDYGGQCMKDYFTAIDEMAKEPFVDKDRLGCVGASFGGFSVYWLAGHHDKRFKAFIAHDGIFNMEMQYLETEEKWFANWDMGGAYWEKDNATAQRTFANSPHLFVDKWDTPILCIHGEKDFRILANQAMAAFDAAVMRGVPAELLIYPDENHWVLKPQNGVLWQRTFFEWLDKWLKPAKQ